MKEKNSAGLHWISPNSENLSKEVSVTVLLWNWQPTWYQLIHIPRDDLCCWVHVQAHWHTWGEIWWCQVWHLAPLVLMFAMLFLGCRAEFEICVPVINYLEWASGWQALFFLGHSDFSERSLDRSRGCQSWGRKVKVLGWNVTVPSCIFYCRKQAHVQTFSAVETNLLVLTGMSE